MRSLREILEDIKAVTGRITQRAGQSAIQGAQMMGQDMLGAAASLGRGAQQGAQEMGDTAQELAQNAGGVVHDAGVYAGAVGGVMQAGIDTAMNNERAYGAQQELANLGTSLHYENPEGYRNSLPGTISKKAGAWLGEAPAQVGEHRIFETSDKELSAHNDVLASFVDPVLNPAFEGSLVAAEGMVGKFLAKLKLAKGAKLKAKDVQAAFAATKDAALKEGDHVAVTAAEHAIANLPAKDPLDANEVVSAITAKVNEAHAEKQAITAVAPAVPEVPKPAAPKPGSLVVKHAGKPVPADVQKLVESIDAQSHLTVDDAEALLNALDASDDTIDAHEALMEELDRVRTAGRSVISTKQWLKNSDFVFHSVPDPRPFRSPHGGFSREMQRIIYELADQGSGTADAWERKIKAYAHAHASELSSNEYNQLRRMEEHLMDYDDNAVIVAEDLFKHADIERVSAKTDKPTRILSGAQVAEAAAKGKKLTLYDALDQSSDAYQKLDAFSENDILGVIFDGSTQRVSERLAETLVRVRANESVDALDLRYAVETLDVLISKAEQKFASVKGTLAEGVTLEGKTEQLNKLKDLRNTLKKSLGLFERKAQKPMVSMANIHPDKLKKAADNGGLLYQSSNTNKPNKLHAQHGPVTVMLSKKAVEKGHKITADIYSPLTRNIGKKMVIEGAEALHKLATDAIVGFSQVMKRAVKEKTSWSEPGVWDYDMHVQQAPRVIERVALRIKRLQRGETLDILTIGNYSISPVVHKAALEKLPFLANYSEDVARVLQSISHSRRGAMARAGALVKQLEKDGYHYSPSKKTQRFAYFHYGVTNITPAEEKGAELLADINNAGIEYIRAAARTSKLKERVAKVVQVAGKDVPLTAESRAAHAEETFRQGMRLTESGQTSGRVGEYEHFQALAAPEMTLEQLRDYAHSPASRVTSDFEKNTKGKWDNSIRSKVSDLPTKKYAEAGIPLPEWHRGAKTTDTSLTENLRLSSVHPRTIVEHIREAYTKNNFKPVSRRKFRAVLEEIGVKVGQVPKDTIDQIHNYMDDYYYAQKPVHHKTETKFTDPKPLSGSSLSAIVTQTVEDYRAALKDAKKLRVDPSRIFLVENREQFIRYYKNAMYAIAPGVLALPAGYKALHGRGSGNRNDKKKLD